MKKRLLNNKGFSLVELIVTVLVTAILMLGVMAFMSTSRNTYSTVATSAKLQEEALTVEKVLSEFLKEADAYGFKTNLGRSITGFSGNQDLLWIYAKDNTDSTQYSCYFFILEKPADGKPGKLRFSKAPATAVNLSSNPVSISETSLANWVDPVINNKYALVAENIVSITEQSGFSDDETGKKLILLTCKYRYNNTEFTSNVSAVSRNIKD